MQHSVISRLLLGASVVVATAIPMNAAQAAPGQPMFSSAQGWRADVHERVLADVNGDGRADLVGFGDRGVQIGHGQPDGTFSSPVPAVRDFGRHQGWHYAIHPRMAADIDGDGRADLVGFGYNGVHVAYSQADGTFSASEVRVRDFGYNNGWNNAQDLNNHYHQRELADVDADGRLDVVGFGDAGVLVSYSQADGSFSAPVLEVRDFGWNQGWRNERHERELADVDGDGRVDVVGFGHAGTYVAYSSALGDGFTAPELEIRNFGYAQGWRVGPYSTAPLADLLRKHSREVGDVNGDGLADVVGFGDAGAFVSYSRGGGNYAPVVLKHETFVHDTEWPSDPWGVRLLTDINGDGIQDLAGFQDLSVYANGGIILYLAPGRTDDTFGPDLYIRYEGADQPGLLGDVDGDGHLDVVGFRDDGTYVTLI
jgi:hypothetical protein